MNINKKTMTGALVALAILGVSVPGTAKAQSLSDLEAMIASLQEQIRQLQGATAAFYRDLTIGSTGSDVVALQSWLEVKGYLVMPPGVAKGYFGPLTQAAVARYQAAVGIMPTAGYFGPLTRARVNAAAPAIPHIPGPVVPSTRGAEGELRSFDLIGSVSGENLDEGERDAKVLGVEAEAKDSDITIERVDVDFELTSGTASDKLDDYVTDVSLWLGSKKLATLKVDAADEDNDVYSFRFTGLKGVIREGDTGELYVAVSAVRNVDSDDEDGEWTVEIPANGIRATDEAGLSETYVDGSDDLSETFTVGSAASGQLDITKASESPRTGIVQVSDDNDTGGVTLVSLDLEADESDITIKDLPVTIVATGASVSDIVKNVRLMDGSKVLKSRSIPSGAGSSYQVVFDNIDYDVSEGDTETLKVVAEINDLEGAFTEGDSVYATIAGNAAAWDVEDARGDDVTPDGTVTGDAQAFFLDGITVTKVSSSATVIAGNAQANESDRGQYVVEFKVKAEGNDIYIDRGTTATSAPGANLDGAGYSETSDSASGASLTALFDAADTDNDDTASYFVIRQGDTRTFRLNVSAVAGSDGYVALMLTGFTWGTDAGSIDRVYTYDLNSFRTNSIYLDNR